MLLVLWIDQLAAKHLEAGERALLVRTHQPAIAGNIGDENSGELAFGLIFGHWGRLPQFLIYILSPNSMPFEASRRMAAVRWVLTFDRAAPTPEPSHAEASKDEAPRLATGKFAPPRQPELEHEGAGEGAKPVDLRIDQPTRI